MKRAGSTSHKPYEKEWRYPIDMLDAEAWALTEQRLGLASSCVAYFLPRR